jgi:hypothetical protein
MENPIYIGPLHSTDHVAFGIGRAPYSYVPDMTHDGWRLFLPYVIDTYKNWTASVTREGLVSWYRRNPTGCSDSDTTGNTASQLQIEFEPTVVAQDGIFYSVLLILVTQSQSLLEARSNLGLGRTSRAAELVFTMAILHK